MDEGNDARSGPERQLIAFSLHGEHYALPIASVREIIRYTPPRATATARGLIQGMINLRGRLLPVVDLAGRLGQVMEITGATRILVIEVSTGLLGLIVDRAEGVIQVPTHRIEEIPGAVADHALGHQIAAIEDQLIMLVDPERAFRDVLPGRPADDRTATSERPRPRGARRAARGQGPAQAPPSRRRSAATPQAPRPRRNKPHGKDGGE